MKPPATVRQLATPAALELADLTAIFEELSKTAQCCEQILTASEQGEWAEKETLVESLWITALVSYWRCFCDSKSGAKLREQDFEETSLQGDVAQWHNTLGKIRAHYVGSSLNPRDSFVVGVAQDSDGNASGIAVTSTPRPQPDGTTVRQTGQLALELSRLVDKRIRDQQEDLYNTARAMSPESLSLLPTVHIANPNDGGSATIESSASEGRDQT